MCHFVIGMFVIDTCTSLVGTDSRRKARRGNCMVIGGNAKTSNVADKLATHQKIKKLVLF